MVNVFSYEGDNPTATDVHTKRIEFNGTYDEARGIVAEFVKGIEDKQKEKLPY